MGGHLNVRSMGHRFGLTSKPLTAKRTRRGKIQKAQEGKIVATMKPLYGFSYNARRDGLVVNKGDMAVVESILRTAAEGFGTKAIQGRLYERGIPAPWGGESGSGTLSGAS